MGDFLDRMDDFYGIGEGASYSDEELSKYKTYKVDHYYEIRWNGGSKFQVTDCGSVCVYEHKKTHKKYHMLYEGLEELGKFRFDYFMCTLSNSIPEFKKALRERIQEKIIAIKKDAEYEIGLLEKELKQIK